MKYKDIKGLTSAEIADRVREEKINLVKMRLSHAVAALEDPSSMTKTRKLIARLKTELSSRKTQA